MANRFIIDHSLPVHDDDRLTPAEGGAAMKSAYRDPAPLHVSADMWASHEQTGTQPPGRACRRTRIADACWR